MPLARQSPSASQKDLRLSSDALLDDPQSSPAPDDDQTGTDRGDEGVDASCCLVPGDA